MQHPAHVPAAAHQQSGLKGCLWVCCALFVLAILTSTLLFAMWSRATAQAVEEQIATIRAKGQPVTPADLDIFYAYPPTDKDATDLWLAAIESISTDQFNEAVESLPVVGQSEIPIPPPGSAWEQLEEVEAFLVQHADSMQQLHDAARMGGAARYDIEFEDGIGLLLKHVQDLREGARMLTLEAHVRAHRGDTIGAAESIVSCIQLARSLEKEPILVSQLVCIAIHSIAYNLVHELLPYVNVSDESLAELQIAMRSSSFRDGFHGALMGERVMGIDAMRRPELLSESSDFPHLPFRSEDLSNYIELMTRLIDASEQSWAAARTEAQLIGQDLGEILRSPVGKFRYTLTAMVMPPNEAALMAEAGIEATCMCTDAMIAIERYRRQHGEMPDTLDAVVPEILPQMPIDPFDGNPLRYMLGENEVVIYSIGRDGVDNGGERGEANVESDIVVRFPYDRS